MHWVWKNVIWCNFILPAPICMASKKNKLKSYKTHVVILKYCLINYYFANNPTCTRKPCIFFYNLRVILKKMVGYQRWLSKEPVCYGRGLEMMSFCSLPLHMLILEPREPSTGQWLRQNLVFITEHHVYNINTSVMSEWRNSTTSHTNYK